jgi:hypothetical protein
MATRRRQSSSARWVRGRLLVCMSHSGHLDAVASSVKLEVLLQLLHASQMSRPCTCRHPSAIWVAAGRGLRNISTDVWQLIFWQQLSA